MQALTNMLGENKALVIGAAALAFFVAAVLILLVFRLAFGRRLRMPGGRARQMRLGIVDAFDLDRQRQLVIVRRDNVEHLVMIGGPNDILIESQINRVDARRDKDAGREKEPIYAVPAPASKPHSEPKMPIPPSMPTPEPQPIAAADELADFGAPQRSVAAGPGQGSRRMAMGAVKLPSVHEGPAASQADAPSKPPPAPKSPADATALGEAGDTAGFMRWPNSNRAVPVPPQPPRPLKRPIGPSTPPVRPARPTAVPTPAAVETPPVGWPPVPSIEGLESLEEEMAKLLGRGPVTKQ